MILELNKIFEGYTPVILLGRSSSYREVYLAENEFGIYVCMTVYDMNCLPDCYMDGKIPEFEMIPQLSNNCFPTYLDKGRFCADNRDICWMLTQYVGQLTLTDYMLSGKICDEKEMLSNFYDLLLALKELYWRLGGGCCNNISTDNIIVRKDDSGKSKWLFTGLDCVSGACKGRAAFDTSVQSPSFLAPETLLGFYNIKTDIFSLGIILAIILQGKHPWEQFFGHDLHTLDAVTVKRIRENPPVLEMQDSLKTIVSKAISTNPSGRYKSIEDFGAAIAKYIGNENLTNFECFTPADSTSDSALMRENLGEGKTDLVKHQGMPQPKASVRIERAAGNGFKDVAGMESLKSMLTRDFVDIIQNRELAEAFQITPPNGILLWGPPGTGKTFISRKLAEESGLLFCLVKPSDLGNIYIHGSQSMIADLFLRSEELAKKNNCGVLLVFDEFDSLVPRRKAIDDCNQANEVSEFLTRLNDCAERNVYVVATTNRIEAIDPAIIRKGRMDEIIYVGLPDALARRELLEIEILKRPHDEIDTAHLVDLTSGYSSSDISFIVKECARCSFEESVKTKHLVRINQDLLEKVIARTRPSVTVDEIRQFELTRESFDQGRKAKRPCIGFSQMSR